MGVRFVREAAERWSSGDLLDREGAAKLLRISSRTLDRWHHTGEGPPRIKVGAKVFYRRTALDEWLVGREAFG